MSSTEQLERRLRADLPRLADALLEGGPDEPRPLPIAGPRRSSPRRVLVGAIVVAAAVAAAVVSGVVGDDEAPQTVAAAPERDPVFEGAWRELAPAPLREREGAVTVWTGEELIIWGGHRSLLALADGAAYDPATDSWRSITANQWAHPGAIAAWTGDEMVVLAKNGGAAYDPATDSWRDLAMIEDTVVGFRDVFWTGERLLAVGWVTFVTGTGDGDDRGDGTATVAVYDVESDTWQVGASIQGPLDESTRSTWTGTRLILWGGSVGWVYDPLTDEWSALPELAAPRGRALGPATAGGFGERVVVVAELVGDRVHEVQVAELVGDEWSWRDPGFDEIRLDGPAATTAGPIMFIDGSDGPGGPVAVDTVKGELVALADFPLVAATNRSVAWTGSELIVWGGLKLDVDAETADGVVTTARGARWRPVPE